MSVPYAKVPCPIPDQLQLLISRGLVVADRPAAEAFLSRVSYYRFSGYVLPFESVRHAFRPGVTFEDVQRLYQMDEALRQAIFAALSPVEVLLRARVGRSCRRKGGRPVLYGKNRGGFQGMPIRFCPHNAPKIAENSICVGAQHFSFRQASAEMVQLPLWNWKSVDR